MKKLFSGLIFSALMILPATDSGVAANQIKDIPANGITCAGMRDFEKQFLAYLKKEQIPGATVTVGYKGKIIFSRAYGYANQQKKTLLQPGASFRIASLSKSITAIAVMSLCEKSKLSLDDKAFQILNEIKPCDPQQKVDLRISKITIRDLLQCSAGWSHAGMDDPILGNRLAISAQNCTNRLRPSNLAIIRSLLMDKLDYNPGTTYSYSNVSYCILGQIIEKITAEKYADYVNKLIFQPESLRSFSLGSTTSTAAGEVEYYPVESAVENMLPNFKTPLGAANGGFFLLEAAPATIGWIASTDDLVRFISILCGESNIAPPLSRSSFQQMLTRPKLDCWNDTPEYFAFGWEVERGKNGKLIAFSRHGSLPGSMALIEHQSNGISWAAAFNKRPTSYVQSREEVKAIIKKSMKDLNTLLSKSH